MLGSNYEPCHILSKSRTVEKLDKSDLLVLSKLEKDIKLQEKLESISPALKPFFVEKMLLLKLVLLLYLSLWPMISQYILVLSLMNLITLLKEEEKLSIYPYTTKVDLQN